MRIRTVGTEKARRGADAGARAPHVARTLRCLHAEVALTESTQRHELRRARAQAVRGDAAWRARLQAYENGDALIVALTAHAVIDDSAEASAPATPWCYCHEAIWIDRDTAPSPLGDHLRTVARRAFAPVAAGLRDRGVTLDARADQITVQLTIDPAVAARLGAPT